MSDTTVPSRGLPAILLSLVLGSIAIGGGFYRLNVEEAPLSWDSSFWEPSGQAVKAYLIRDGKLLEQHPPKDEESTLVAAFKTANSLVNSTKDGVGLGDYREALTRLEAESTHFFRQYGAESYRAVGLRLWHLMADALRTGTPQEQQAFGGDIMGEVHRAGLLNTDGEWQPGAWVILRMLYMLRWSHLIHQASPGDAVLHALERTTIPGWKAEAHPDLNSPDLRDRLQYAVDAGRMDPDYPTTLVQGILFARYGLMDESLPLLRQGVLERPEMTRWSDQLARLEAKMIEN